jgi:hypothetical protein
METMMNTVTTKTSPQSRTRHPFLKAFACGAFVHVCLLVSVGSGSTEITGYFFGMAMLPALITGILARRATTAWPPWQIVGTYILAFLVVVYLQVRR